MFKVYNSALSCILCPVWGVDAVQFLLIHFLTFFWLSNDAESQLVLIICTKLQQTAVCCKLTLSEFIVFERYHLFVLPPSGSSSAPSGGRGPIQT